MPRATQPSTGSSTTRRSSSVSATTSWPGVKGKLTMGSKYRLAVPSTVDRSLPQMPARRGRSHTHSGPGRSGGSTSSRPSGP